MNAGDKPGAADLKEITRLVEALENDLKKVREGSSDLDALRSEVEQLQALLDSAERDHRELHEGLHGVRSLLQRVETELMDDAFTASQYVVRIGKMLGM
jgi:chromosome segregation ATPase